VRARDGDSCQVMAALTRAPATGEVMGSFVWSRVCGACFAKGRKRRSRLCQPHKWLLACAKGIDHLAKKKIGHLSNAETPRCPLRLGGFLCVCVS